jgi:inward rectifier potassium channel
MATNKLNREMSIQRLGVEETLWEDIYHRLLRWSWGRFFALILLVYLSIDLIFALLYFAVPGCVANIPNGDFLSNFAFSVQTMSTLGYGYFYPQTPYSHLIVTVESAIGLFSTALLTGLVFAKFARPSARVVFSDKIVWGKMNGGEVLSVRLGNVRTNQVFEGTAKMTLLRDETSAEGERLRRLINLKLVRHETPLFALSWTLFHQIDSSSPFYGMTPEKLHQENWEVIVTFSGLDQDVGQTIVAHSMYNTKMIVPAKKFADMITTGDGVRTIDFSKLHDIELEPERKPIDA